MEDLTVNIGTDGIKMLNLEFISFVGTNILDGNLHWCKGIGYVGFENKRHYSHKFKDFKK
jgi:hypothetical protein